MRSESLALARNLIQRFEGLRLVPYRDSGGFWTVGWGHLLSRDTSLPQPLPITKEQADVYLERDISKAARSVSRLCPVPLNQGQEASLVDFAFNLGAGTLQISALRSMINRGAMDEAANEFGRWVYCRHIRLAGLVRRREAERLLFVNGG